MTLRAKAALLLGLLAAALWSGAEAVRSLAPEKNAHLPQDIYQSYARRAEAAEYVLRGDAGYVAVYEKAKDREPVTVTGIELKCLREADRAMLEAGIPVINRRELLLSLAAGTEE